MLVTTLKFFLGFLYEYAFKGILTLIELNVVPDFIIRRGIRLLQQTRIDVVRAKRQAVSDCHFSKDYFPQLWDSLCDRREKRSRACQPHHARVYRTFPPPKLAVLF